MTGRLRGLAAAAALGVLLAAGCGQAVEPDDLKAISLPPGFHISLYASVPGARSMALAPPLGALFVGSRGEAVHAVFDRDNDGKADEVLPVSRSLKVPNGIAWRDGWLYVAEQHRIIRYRPAPAKLGPQNPEVIYDRLPDISHHGWRYAAFGPDGRLYVTVGAPCNICEIDGLEGTVLRLDADGGNAEVFARGVRNSVGIDFHPRTGEAFFTDNGGDWLGDDLPPDELNRATRPGLHYGFPHYAGGSAVSPDWKNRAPPPDAQFPVIEFDAHVAALGIHFYRGDMFPAEYRNDAFVAEHGSWNRTSPVGYRIMRVRFDDEGKATGKEVFAEGWLKDGSSWGRPVDIEELPDGSLLVSDDSGGAIYRITYER